MITGYNTDVEHNDRVYHIQTEDKGLANPYIESLVYVGGEILASKKTSYAHHIAEGIDDKWISGLMEQQHRTMIAAIKRGRFDNAEEDRGNSTLAAARAQVEAAEEVVIPALDDPSERTLDQVILDYLASEAEHDHLELQMLSHVEFVSGAPAEFRIAARKSLSQQPISGASIEVKVLSTTHPPQVLFKGVTGNDGMAHVRCSVPQFGEGTAAIIVSAHSTLGNDELKQLVRRRAAK
jgi:hypothetical protein